ncbi:MAG TPA: hypothetical protein VNJ08_01725 [Bacteriovoracaceae bacterium]|nr:hypothetical protein [Bacteriovoracaceae bacterium]
MTLMAEDHAAHSIVIKIYLDMPKPEDKVLIEELKKHKNVFTQALAEKGDPWQGEIPLHSLRKNKYKLPEYNTGWIPGKEMASTFKGVGITNGYSNSKNGPAEFFLVNSIQGNVYASLPLLLAADYSKSKINYGDKAVMLGKKKIETLPWGSIKIPAFPKPFPWKTYSFIEYSFIELLDGKIPQKEFNEKVVIIFYNGKHNPPIPIADGRTVDQSQIVALMTDFLLAHVMH